MSLTSELSDPGSPLAAWCAETFVGTPAVVEQVVAATRDVTPVRPVSRDVSGRHWAEIGGAWGQRLADLVQPAPPYYALLGMIRAGWVSWGWAHQQAARYPTHRDLPEEFRARALGIRPAVSTWLDLGADPTTGTGEASTAGQVWTELLERARAYLAAHARTGELGSPGAEAGLARTSWVLSACEDTYRSGVVDERLSRLFDSGRSPSVEQLRGLAPDEQVAELVALGRQLQLAALKEMRDLAGNPAPGQALGIAGPTIVPGWADADLLLGPTTPTDARGATLIDVKTVISLRDPERVARWIWQILLYAWLDTADLYRIRRVGLLLARHGVLITWPLARLVDQLLSRRNAGEHHRDQARDLAGRLITATGARFPIA